MGLFDSLGDLSVQGDYGPTADTPIQGDLSVGTPDSNPDAFMFSQTLGTDLTVLPAGYTDLPQRSNSSFWDFDQSKIPASLTDILNSGLQAGSKVALTAASDSINAAAGNKSNPWLANFASSFRSTGTGAQITAGAYATKVQNFLGNPIVWLGVAALALFLIFRR